MAGAKGGELEKESFTGGLAGSCNNSGFYPERSGSSSEQWYTGKLNLKKKKPWFFSICLFLWCKYSPTAYSKLPT